ncbi:GPI mannosyltransferase 3 [Eumeta japonica]|uniref:Mannosyltransferase n=1 Tax=Eumeta variegata TaxID=151549 RepID=A0A4C1YM77_EUMVA|nr:GPI mannosyltransferase 3 [Eumeta japonica]
MSEGKIRPVKVDLSSREKVRILLLSGCNLPDVKCHRTSDEEKILGESVQCGMSMKDFSGLGLFQVNKIYNSDGKYLNICFTNYYVLFRKESSLVPEDSLISATAYIALDSYFYGRLVITPWEFFKFNILHDVASHYGTHPWYWYLTQGLPAVLGVSFAGLLWATYTVLRHPSEHKIGLLLLAVMAVHVVLHSFVPHKEFRFMLPILPMIYYLTQDVIVRWSRKAPQANKHATHEKIGGYQSPMNTRDSGEVTSVLPASWVVMQYLTERGGMMGRGGANTRMLWVVGGSGFWNSHSLDEIKQWELLLHACVLWRIYALAFGLLFGNLMPALYFGMIHQSGTLKVMPLLREAMPSNTSSVLFAMPCHSTPLYSHLHINVTTHHLNCDPPLSVRIGEGDESERFMQNPVRWWRAEFANRPGPDYVVMFDKVKPRLQPVLATYKLTHELAHTQFPQGEVSEKVLVFAKTSKSVEADEVV